MDEENNDQKKPDESPDESPQIDPTPSFNFYKRQSNIPRRRFIRDSIIAVTLGSGLGTSSYFGLKKLGKNSIDTLKQSYKELTNIVSQNISLTDSLDKNIIKDIDNIKEFYRSGSFDIIKEFGIVDIGDVNALDELLKENKWSEFNPDILIDLKDGIDKRIAAADSEFDESLIEFSRKLNEYKPDDLKEFDEIIIHTMKTLLYGPMDKKSWRTSLSAKERINYDILSMIEIFSGKGNKKQKFEKAKTYFFDRKGKKPPVYALEKEFHNFLQENYMQGRYKLMEDFITYHPNNEERNFALLDLRSKVKKIESHYVDIAEKAEYADQFRELIKQGSELREEYRKKSLAELDNHKDSMIRSVSDYRSKVLNLYDSAVKKGIIDKDKQFDDATRLIRGVSAAAIGILTTYSVWSNRKAEHYKNLKKY